MLLFDTIVLTNVECRPKQVFDIFFLPFNFIITS